MRVRLRSSARGPSSEHASRVSAALAAAVMAALAVTGAAQRQFDELGKRGLPPDRDETLATVLGDVDLDLVAGNRATRRASRTACT